MTVDIGILDPSIHVTIHGAEWRNSISVAHHCKKFRVAACGLYDVDTILWICMCVRRWSCGRVGRRSVRWRRLSLIRRSVAATSRRLVEQRRRRRQQDEKDTQSEDGVHRPPAQHAGAELRATEIPQCSGPHGARVETEPQRHAGQDLVPEPQVRTYGHYQWQFHMAWGMFRHKSSL